jgi:hypothetical protein
LLGAPKMQYQTGIWNKPDEQISNHPRKGGGLWVTPTLAIAKAFQKYVLKKHQTKTRIFSCKIGKILHQTTCRIKTNQVFFEVKDEVIN